MIMMGSREDFTYDRAGDGAGDEFILAATAQNLQKMAKLIPMQTPRLSASET
jgi:hypothetical protein